MSLPLGQVTRKHKAILLVIIPLAFEMIILASLWSLLQQSEHEAAREARSKSIADSTASISRSLADGATSMALFWMTRDKTQQERYKSAMDTLDPSIQQLKVLCSDNAEELKIIAKLENSSEQTKKLLNQLDESIDGSGEKLGALSAAEIRSEAKHCIKSLAKDLQEFEAIEQARGIVRPKSEQQFRSSVKTWLLVGIACNISIALAIAYTLTAAYQKLAVSEQNLRESNDARKHLTAMIGHDLRSPLTALRLVLQSFLQGAYGMQNDVALERLRTSHKSVDSLVDLINDLLDVEKADAGMMELSRAEHHLDDIVLDAIDRIQPVADAKEISIDHNIQPITINCDGRRVERVLVNLLANAVKFSPESTAIRVSANQVGDQIELHVIDSGRGIPKELQATVFERYSQVEGQDETSGTGLGLSNCKVIVQAHGGELGVNSELGAGSDFWFRLPAPLRTSSNAI